MIASYDILQTANPAIVTPPMHARPSLFYAAFCKVVVEGMATAYYEKCRIFAQVRSRQMLLFPEF